MQNNKILYVLTGNIKKKKKSTIPYTIVKNTRIMQQNKCTFPRKKYVWSSYL